MYTVPSYVTYRTEEDAIYITSELYRNTVRLTDHGLQKEFINLTRCGGCAELNTPLTRYLHEQELLVTEEELDHALHQVRSLLDNIFMVTLMPTEGCNFRCLYCANPDTIDACGGKPTPAEEILRMATDQKPFFGRRGGVTFSGGEPTFQAAALVPLVRQLHGAGIHVCLDSNGGVWNPAVEELLGLVDLVLLDIKQADPERHRTLTGRDNAQTLRTAAWLEEHGKPFWLRYVLVPGYSDAEADIRALGERLGGYKQVERVEILPYHTLGVHKYEAMGKEYRLAGVQENTPEQSERAAALFREYFPTVVVN